MGMSSSPPASLDALAVRSRAKGSWIMRTKHHIVYRSNPPISSHIRMIRRGTGALYGIGGEPFRSHAVWRQETPRAASVYSLTKRHRMARCSKTLVPLRTEPVPEDFAKVAVHSLANGRVHMQCQTGRVNLDSVPALSGKFDSMSSPALSRIAYHSP